MGTKKKGLEALKGGGLDHLIILELFLWKLSKF